ncbi:MAG: CDP-glycerol glycerophosphotransferase family protein [Chloroflexota bacterium]|nr:CDP-glycerol glycerophosphotransferase family protein [Chloroflexota bacterium]
MSVAIVTIRIWLVRVGFLLGSVGAPGRHVLLATAHADRLGGNLAVIRDELAARRLPHRVLAHRTTGGWRGRLAGAIAAIRSGYALARARVVVVDDYFFPIYVIRPRSGTTIVQTWHASGAFKRFGHSVRDASFGADAALTDRVRIHANYDVCLVGSAEAATHYADAFALPIARFRWDLGVPRTDVFFAPDERRAAEQRVRERYDIPADRRVVLWAPTFRGDRVTDARDADALDLGTLAAALSDDHLVLLRLHPFVRARLSIPAAAAPFVRDVSAHPDINELMFVADALVTDYSSAIFEYSLLERPMAFFAPDLDGYERERGFYVDYRSWVPGPVFDRSEDLAAWLRSGEPDLDRVRRFRNASFAVADGRATDRLVDEVLLPALG